MTAQQHPAWCNPEECRLNLTPPGRHLSTITVVETSVLTLQVFLAEYEGGPVSVEVDAYALDETGEESFMFGAVMSAEDAQNLARVLDEHGRWAQA